MIKVGKANLAKAIGFEQERNFAQSFRYAELAATKFKLLKDRRLETVELIDAALMYKFIALNFMSRNREALECIKECYTMWAMNHLRHSGSIRAALGLIESCIHNREYEDAESYARHAYFMIAEMTDNFIPTDEQPKFLGDGSYYLATAIYHLARTGGIPPEAKQKAGEEAIALARKALEINTQLFGVESSKVAMVVGIIADVLDHFNDVDNDEIFRLREQSIATFSRVEGSSSVNVAMQENKWGNAYRSIARRACYANDLDRGKVYLELALPHYRESARIFRLINHLESTDGALSNIAQTEDAIRQIGIARDRAATAVTRG